MQKDEKKNKIYCNIQNFKVFVFSRVLNRLSKLFTFICTIELYKKFDL